VTRTGIEPMLPP